MANDKIPFGMAIQRELQPAYAAAIGRLTATNPGDAQIITGFVSALRTECSGRRIEARNLRENAGVER